MKDESDDGRSDSSFILHPSSFPTILMGLRGSGKSTLGRRLADEIGAGCIDLDDRTRARLACRTVAEAFETRGEKAFRQAEVAALRDALEEAWRRAGGQGERAGAGAEQDSETEPTGSARADAALVIALGGGTPTAPGAADLLREAAAAGARLVYLHASAPTLRARLKGGDPNRPSLTGAGLLAEIDEILGARDSLYRELATVVVETDGLDADGAMEALRRAMPE